MLLGHTHMWRTFGQIVLYALIRYGAIIVFCAIFAALPLLYPEHIDLLTSDENTGDIWHGFSLLVGFSVVAALFLYWKKPL